MSLLRSALFLAALRSVSAHGVVTGIVADGTYYHGYTPGDQFRDPPPSLIAWSTPQNWDSGFIGGVNYTEPQINCHRNSTPGTASAKVSAGSAVDLQWVHWPNSHHGPVLDYLARCPGSCSDVDETELEWFKISAAGLGFHKNSTYPLGWWATSLLNWNNDSWSVIIPPTIAPGNYVLRHEIIALHNASYLNGAQNYPQCVNLEITSDGTDEPQGVKGTELYHPTDPGLHINIWMQVIHTYTMPGPTLYSGAVSMSQTTLDIKNYAPTTLTSPIPASATPSPQTAVAVATSPTPADLSSSSSPSSSSSDDDPCTHTAMATATPPSNSQIAEIASAVPSEYLTSTIDTAPLPSATGGIGGAKYHWGDKPSKPLPEGYTLSDFLEWTAYTVKKAWKEERVHQRDFVGAME